MKSKVKSNNIIFSYEVDSIKDVYAFLVWKKHKKTTFLFIFLYILIILYLFVFGDYEMFFTILILLFVFNSIFLTVLWNKSEVPFFENFALFNNLSFSPNSNLASVSGRLFELGRPYGKKIRNVMSGQYLNWPIRIFIYSFVVGTGRSQKTVENTVLEISFENIAFPHILLRSKGFKNFLFSPVYGGSIAREKNDEDISLGGKYKNFELRASRGYHIEVMQIFSLDLLDFLENQTHKFNIEFSENKINIFDNKVVKNRKDLTELYGVGKKILDSAGFLIDRLSDDFEALHPYYKK